MRGPGVAVERVSLTGIQIALIVQWGVLIYIGVTQGNPWLWGGGLIGMAIAAITVAALWRMRRPRSSVGPSG